MSCKICGRNSCCESFHSLEEQEHHEKESDIVELEKEIERLEKENLEYFITKTG